MGRLHCRATTKKGSPCPTPAWNNSEFCVGHDPAITKQMRDEWRERARSSPKHRVQDYKFLTPLEIVHYVSKKVKDLEAKYGESIDLLPVIADFLRVAIQANRLVQNKTELALAKKDSNGPRTVRIVRDEVADPVADAG